ncbi:hypothetical protein ACK3TF_005846 [Chlorella vulgaris]
MLLAPFERFSDSALEAQYQQSKRERLSHADMWSAALFVLLWAHDLWRFLGAHPLALIKATIWMAAVGMKPVYVMLLVGKPFYQQYRRARQTSSAALLLPGCRAWIISFTKIVFAVHPPGEGLHVLRMSGTRQEAPAGGVAATLAALWELANGMRLPYIMLTGLGWQDLLHNMPVQLALVVRAIRDNQAQCAAPFFTAPQTREALNGLAHCLTSLLSTSLSLGAGIKGQQSSFPAGLDPCCALGAWAAICFGCLLTTVAVTAGERRARARQAPPGCTAWPLACAPALPSFALRYSARLTDSERNVFAERQSAGNWGTWAVFAYLCVLAWQAVLVAFSWAAGEGLYSLNVFASGSDGATPNTSVA